MANSLDNSREPCEDLEGEDPGNTEVESLRRQNPELYGALLSANARTSDAGLAEFWVVAVFTVAACVGLSTQVLDVLVAMNLDAFRAWPSYVLIGMIGVGIGGWLASKTEERAYHVIRGDLLRLCKSAGFSKYQLVALLNNADELGSVTARLKKDESEEG